MSKPASSRRSNQPPIPVVAPETWRRLLAAAADYHALAPWTWMHDSELLGLPDPVTKDELLCSVVGRLGEVFGLLVYRGDAGRRWLIETIFNDGGSDEFEQEDTGFEQDFIKLEFVPKGSLVQQDRDVLEAAGYSPEVKRGPVWPTIRGLVPGGYPWHPTQTEAELLIYALPRVSAFAELVRATPGLRVDLVDERAPFLSGDFDPSTRALRSEDLDWRPLILPPEPVVPSLSLNDETVSALLKLPPAKGFHLELDLFYSPIPIGEGERPWFPRTAMAVERASGMIGGYQLGKSSDLPGDGALAEVLVSTIRQVGGRPESIRVQRRRVARMLAEILGRLEIPLREERELAALNSARAQVEERFR
jgi:hypothetical protein